MLHMTGMTSPAVRDRRVHQKVQIGVDARLAESTGTGVASYRHAVLGALAAIGRSTVDLRDITVGRFGEPSSRLEALTRWLAASSSHPRKLLAQATDAGSDMLWRRDIFRLAHVHFRRHGTLLRLTPPQPVGVMHWTYPLPAIVDGWINLHTVHDAIPMRRPDLSPVDPARLRACLTAIAAQTDGIVTVSDWARRTILESLAIRPDLVTNCGGGLAGLVGAGGRLPAGLKRGGYLLFCGLIEPRKNLARLAAAWTSATGTAGGYAMPLVVAGPDGAGCGALRSELEAAGVVVLPYQDRPVLMDLIGQARAFVFPSLEEGFGLPVAEAMALGTPVLTADRGALQEIAGGACLLVDPTDEQSIADGIRRIVADDALCATLTERGAVRARAFAPTAFGARLAVLYDRLIDARIADGLWPYLETADEI